MKKLTILFICLLSVLNINAAINSGSCGDNARYTLDTETGVLSITGTGAMTNYTTNSSGYANTPWSSRSRYIYKIEIADGITTIGGNAFRDCSRLVSVTISNSVTSIEFGAFLGCSGLTSIEIPNSVISIGNSAFFRCSGLTTVTIPNSVTSIGDDAFSECSGLTSIEIPNSVISIGNSAFFRCSGLTSVTIGNSVTSIGNNAFLGCSSLKSITIPNSVTSIGGTVFQDCSALTSISVESGNSKYDSRNNCNAIIETSTNTLIVGCKGTIIPNGITSIGKGAFSECSGLTTVTIPNSVTSIGTNAFYGCSSLKEFFYLSKTPPTYWVATKNTYVPDTKTYSSPSESINGIGIFPMITFESSSFVYTGLSPEPKWINNVNGYEAALSFPDLSKNVGNYEEWIPATFTKGGESFSTNVMCRYTIKPAPLTAKATNISRQYGEENPVFPIEYIGFVNGETESVLTQKPLGKTTADLSSPVGTYPIIVSGGEALNYDITYEQGELSVTGASITAKVKNVTKVYGEENPTFSLEYIGLKNGETVPSWTTAPTFQTEATKNSGVGEYTIKAVGGAAKNYDISFTDGVLTVTQAPLTIKANDASRKYFEEEPSFEFTCTGFLNGDDEKVLTKEPTFSTNATKTSNVGTYKITPSGAEAKNYAMSYEQGDLIITKQQLKVTSHTSRYYGDENPILPIEYIGFVNDETEDVLTKKPVGTTTAKVTSSIGDYPITLSGGEATNYEFVYEQGVLTVNKASLSAKVKDATRVYGKSNPTFSIEYFGLKNGETVPAWTTAPTFQTEATNTSSVGEYAIKAVGGVSPNYELEIEDGTLSITPAPLTIKANDASRLYNDEDPEFEFTCSGFVNNDDVQVLTKLPDFVTDATKTSDVGKYTITPSGAEAKNYEMSYLQGILTINIKEASFITIDDIADVEYNGMAQTPGITVKDGSMILTSGTDYNVVYSNNIKVGTAKVTITCKGNYKGTKYSTFTINSKDASYITIVDIADVTYNGMAQEPAITVKDGETILNNGTDYTISYSDNINAGEATVTVIGKGNYTGTKTATFVISRKSSATITIDDIAAVGYNGMAQTPDITVRDGSTILNSETDYDVVYSNNINVGTAKVTITCKGNYIGTINKTFLIEDVITFADTNVKAICVASWDADGNGEINIVEAQSVSDLGNVFQGKNITSFDELRYFTGITSIPASAFNGCSSLLSIKIPDNVKLIGSSAFMGCSSLTSITIPNNVTSIGSYAFFGTNLCTFIVGTSVSSIGSNTFTNQPVKTIWLPNTPPQGYINAQGVVNYVNNSQYSGFSNKKEYKFLSSMFDVDGVRYVPVSPSERTCDAIDCLYDGKPKEAIINATVSYKNINMNVLNVMPYTFCQGNTLRKVGLDFYGNIEKNVFYSCKSLETVVIGQNVTGIGECAFSGCSSLKNIKFGAQVQTIGKEAFSDCAAVTTIASMALTPPTCGSMALDDINKWECKLYVPEGHVADYQAADQWKEFFFIEEGDPFAILRGDANGDGEVNMDDATFVTNIILSTEDVTEAADVNKDGEINMSDVMFIINYIKNGKFPDE